MLVRRERRCALSVRARGNTVRKTEEPVLEKLRVTQQAVITCVHERSCLQTRKGSGASTSDNCVRALSKARLGFGQSPTGQEFRNIIGIIYVSCSLAICLQGVWGKGGR
eukprot:126539-Pelagomonas_calceolata.AAC.1